MLKGCSLFFLRLMQGFCDPLQGFVNAILFVVLSKRVRRSAYRMVKCWRRSAEEEQTKRELSCARRDDDVVSQYGSVGYVQ